VSPDPDPIALFQEWFAAAHQVGLPEPTAAALATVGAGGRPSVRMVLIRKVDPRGFAFFTNFHSRKAMELAEGGSSAGAAALCFYWPPLSRQVRIEGVASPVSEAEADAYWGTRPRAHQIAAWASPQSQPLTGGREELDRRFAEMDHRLPGENVPRPPFWSGFRVAPDTIEFWEARPGRLHDRVLYRREGPVWVATILAP
jgi:pyridoxamine 5'-phosphate oxidase